MTKMELPAAQVKQGDLTLFTTAIKVKYLIQENFYSVEVLDPKADSKTSGYQRLLNKARARKLADYIVKGQESLDAFLPTSVFLATDKYLDFDDEKNTISFCIENVGPFSVVDGQHRLEGLKMAVDRDSRVLEFSVPVNIAENLPKLHQMCHFFIVNTTQKSVDKSVEQRIISRLTQALEVEEIPSLPRWIQLIVERGEVDKAIRIVDYLNDTDKSPWFKKINLANEPSSRLLKQHSFVDAIVRFLFTANNPIAVLNNFEKEKQIFLNYWIAIADLIDDGNAHVLYKYNSVNLFCRFSIPFFTKLVDERDFTVKTMTKQLRECFDNVEGEFAGLGHAHWWRSGGKASGLNSGAINQVAQELAKALHKPSMSVEIEI